MNRKCVRKVKAVAVLLLFALSLLLSGCSFYFTGTSSQTKSASAPSLTESVGDGATADTDTDAAADTDGSPVVVDRTVHTVFFEKNNGESAESVEVTDGATLAKIPDPEKENYLFYRWYTDGALTKEYDFSEAVTASFTLYAEYIFDAAAVANTIAKETIRSTVTVYSRCYNTRFGVETTYSLSQGSGVIFREEGGYYYLLTNCHVVVNAEYKYASFKIEDYRGTEYTAELYASAIDPDYDLACLRFSATSGAYPCAALSEKDPVAGDDVVACGTPRNQYNAVTFGKAVSYGKVTISDADASESNVTFPVLRHTAFIDHGSSGGALFDSSLRLCGINYAGAEDGSASFTVPISKVRAFLTAYACL